MSNLNNKFCKKPVIIEAEQFFKDGNIPSGVEFDDFLMLYFIDTLEGRLWVSDGDWIITGIHGEQYPCKPDIFEATYQRVEE